MHIPVKSRYKKNYAVIWAQKRPQIQICDTMVVKVLRLYFEKRTFWYFGSPGTHSFESDNVYVIEINFENSCFFM